MVDKPSRAPSQLGSGTSRAVIDALRGDVQSVLPKAQSRLVKVFLASSSAHGEVFRVFSTERNQPRNACYRLSTRAHDYMARCRTRAAAVLLATRR